MCKRCDRSLIDKTLIMNKIFAFILCFLINQYIYAQSLSIERVNKIKSSTVKVTIDSSDKVGTGFFVSAEGILLTCWHVIAPAIYIDSSKKIKIRKIFIELNTGEKFEYGIREDMAGKKNIDAILFDFCILIPVENPNRSFPFLKIGDYNKITEGQEVYTCGYPLAIPQQFISKGIISTKYVDTIFLTNDPKIRKPRNQALMDITLNHGNSGGPVIMIGESINDDVVIGISDFIINPIGQMADKLIDIFNAGKGMVKFAGIDPNEVYILFTQFLNNTSIGVSGCVSINHVLETINRND